MSASWNSGWGLKSSLGLSMWATVTRTPSETGFFPLVHIMMVLPRLTL